MKRSGETNKPKSMAISLIVHQDNLAAADFVKV